MTLFFIGLLLYLTGGLTSEFLPVRYKSIVFSIFAAAGSVLTFICGGSAVLNNQILQKVFLLQFPVGETRFMIDPLAGIFVLIFSIVFPVVSIYSAGYMKRHQDGKKEKLYHFNSALLIISMMLVVTSQNMFLFLI